MAGWVNVFSHGTDSSARGAVLFIKSANAAVLSSAEVVKDERMLIVRAEIGSSVFGFVNIYAPIIGTHRVVFLHSDKK